MSLCVGVGIGVGVVWMCCVCVHVPNSTIFWTRVEYIRNTRCSVVIYIWGGYD